ncbi:MAG: hypothetical protein ACAI44_29740 [Candidatus Sericytochromatia bacterium]
MKLPWSSKSEAEAPRETHSVTLRLDPSRLANPETDLKFAVAEGLRRCHPELWFTEFGFGYARSSDAMLLAFGTREPDLLAKALIDVIEHEEILENRLAPAAIVAIADAGKDFAEHLVVYPDALKGSLLPD